MPIPIAAAAAVPIGAKILGLAKGLVGGAKAAGALKAIGGVGAKAMGKAGSIGRMAGQVFKGGAPKQLSLNLGNAGKASLNMADDAGMIDRIRRGLTSTEGFAKNLGMPLTKQEILASAAPDLFFGGVAALQTEGDIIDKAIAGTGAAAGGALGGIGARGVFGPKSNLGIIASEMGGSMVGDMVGYGAADNIIRMKGGGMTPAEKRMQEGDDQYRDQLLAELKQQYGL